MDKKSYMQGDKNTYMVINIKTKTYIDYYKNKTYNYYKIGGVIYASL